MKCSFDPDAAMFIETRHSSGKSASVVRSLSPVSGFCAHTLSKDKEPSYSFVQLAIWKEFYVEAMAV